MDGDNRRRGGGRMIYRVISYSPRTEKDFTSLYELTQYTHGLILQGKQYDIQIIETWEK